MNIQMKPTDNIRYRSRELYIKILLNDYCNWCVTNEYGLCKLFKMDIWDAIIIEKEIDGKSNRRLNYIGNCKARLCYKE